MKNPRAAMPNYAAGQTSAPAMPGAAPDSMPGATPGPIPAPQAGQGMPQSNLRGLVNTGQMLAQRMRAMAPQGGNPGVVAPSMARPGPLQGQTGQGGPAMGPGAPQGQPGMGGQPGAPGGPFASPQQFPPQVPGTPAYGQSQQGSGIQALIDQLRQQQPQQAQ